MKTYPGLKGVLEMLREIPEAEQDRVLTLLSSQDPELAKRIRDELFQANDLMRIEAKELVNALKSFERPQLLMAMKMVPKEVIQHYKSGLSQRQQKDFDDDFQSQGLHPASKVQQTLKELLTYIQFLRDAGRISIAPK